MTTPDPAEGWYRAPDAKIRPGDIFALAPSWRALKPPLKATGNGQVGKEGRQLVEVFGDKHPLPQKVASGQQDGVFLVPGRAMFGILLTRGCEVDSGKVRQVAAIRPLAEIQGDGKLRSAADNQVDVIDGKAFANHYLPAVPESFGAMFSDSYVDFRYVVTLNDAVLGTLVRSLTLTRAAVHQLYFGWMRHTTGLALEEGPCPKCGEVIPVFVEQPGLLAPAEDY